MGLIFARCLFECVGILGNNRANDALKAVKNPKYTGETKQEETLPPVRMRGTMVQNPKRESEGQLATTIFKKNGQIRPAAHKTQRNVPGYSHSYTKTVILFSRLCIELNIRRT